MSTLSPLAYDVFESLGEGATASVHRAVRQSDGQTVALKRFRLHDPRMRAAVASEIRMLTRLDHPGVVKVLDHGVEGDAAWIAMELVEGRPLADLWSGIDRHAAARQTFQFDLEPSVPERPDAVSPELPSLPFDAMVQLLEALAYLHGQGVVHRDVKPGNAMYAPSGRVVLVDFGLAALTGDDRGDRIEAAADRAGTPRYMAPEQIRGELLDARTDLYAVGVMLYELVTGRPPFLGATTRSWFDHHLSSAPEAIDVPVPKRLARLIEGLLAKNPVDRPGYAIDVAATLAEIADLPPPAPTRPYLYRAPLIGRQMTLATLHDHCARGGVTAVTGPTGSGRTRVLGELVASMRARGLRVHVGAGTPGAEVLAPIRSFLDGAGLDPMAVGTGEVAAVEVVCRAIEGSDTALIAIDDLDAADTLTQKLVRHAARRGFSNGAAIVVSAATDFALDAPRIALDPLNEGQTTALVSGMLAGTHPPDGFAERLHAHTSGNPGFASAFLHQALEGGLLHRTSRGQWILRRDASVDRLELPATLLGLARQRFDTFEASGQRVLAALEILGRTSSPERLARVADDGSGQGLAALRRAGVVSGSHRIRLTDAALGRVAVAQIPTIELHDRAVREAVGVARARHLRAAGRTSEAVDAYVAVGRELNGRQRYSEGADCLKEALSLGDSVHDSTRDQWLVERLEALERIGRIEEVAESLQPLLDRTLTPELRARVLILLASLERARGHDSIDLIRQAMELVEDGEVRYAIHLGSAHAEQRRYEEAFAEFARADAKDLPDYSRVRLLAEWARTHGRHGSPERAISILERAIPLSREFDDAALTRDLTSMLAYCLMEANQTSDAVPLLLDALESARTAGDLETEALILRNLGSAELGRHDPGKAREYLEASLRQMKLLQRERYTASAQLGLGQCLVALRANQRAVACLDEAVASFDRLNVPLHLLHALCERSLANARLGNLEAVLSDADRALELVRAVGGWRINVFLFQVIAALLEVSLPLRAAEFDPHLVGQTPSAEVNAEVSLTRARLHRHSGDLQAAAEHLDAARTPDASAVRRLWIDIEAAWQALARGEWPDLPTFDGEIPEGPPTLAFQELRAALRQG